MSVAPATIDGLPGPRGLPLIGNLLQIDVPRMHEVLEGWAAEHGPMYTFRLGRQPVVVVSDPAWIDQVYRQRPAGFRRMHGMADVIEEMSVHGVFTAEGPVWAQQRKLAMRALAQKNLVGFFPTLREVAENLRQRWIRTAGTPRDVQHDFMCFTVDVTTRLAFAHPTDTLGEQSSPLLDDIHPILPAISRRVAALFPTWRWLRSPADRALDRAVGNVRAFIAEVIAEARADVGQGPPRHFLEAMLQETDGEGSFDDQALFGNAMTMLIAGEDTTANSLAWAVHLLLDHPDVVARLREAVAGPLAGGVMAADVESTRIPYVEQVVHEVMRLKSVGPMLFMEAIGPTRLGELDLPAGMPVVLLTRIPGLDPTVFPDPLRFDPDRWADPHLAARLQKQGVFTPFGSGPRICPGRALALLELQLVLPMLVQGFHLERVGRSEDVREVNGFTNGPQGLSARLSPRA